MGVGDPHKATKLLHQRGRKCRQTLDRYVEEFHDPEQRRVRFHDTIQCVLIVGVGGRIFVLDNQRLPLRTGRTPAVRRWPVSHARGTPSQ